MSTAKLILRNCGIEKAIEVADEAFISGLSMVDFFSERNGHRIYIQRIVNVNIAAEIITLLSDLEKTA